MKKALYSEEFLAMLDRIDEEDYEDRRGEECMRKNRLSKQQVRALEKHFEEENKLHPERKLKIADEVGLEPRQVAVWFQNRRARWRAKQLEKQYDQLRASYDALVNDYGSLEQERISLVTQLKELKAKIEAKTQESSNKSSTPAQKSCVNCNEKCSMTVPFQASTACSSCCTIDPLTISSSSLMDGHQLWKDYQNQLVEMEELDAFSNEDSCNIFSVDHAPTLHWHQGG